MRTHHAAAAIVASLSCALLVAACTHSAPETDGTSDHAPSIETTDDGDLLGGGELPADYEVGGLGTREECYLAGRGGPEAREDFCRSTCPPEHKKACRSLVYKSLVAWVGWCSWNF